jgi:hypothetical protein
VSPCVLALNCCYFSLVEDSDDFNTVYWFDSVLAHWLSSPLHPNRISLQVEVMLSAVTRRALAKLAVANPEKPALLNVRALSSRKSWIPTTDEKLQQVTMRSLIHEVAEQQRELTGKVI